MMYTPTSRMRRLASTVFALALLSQIPMGGLVSKGLPPFRPEEAVAQSACSGTSTVRIGTSFNTSSTFDSQTDQNGNPVSRPGGATLRCPTGKVITSIAYLGAQSGNDATDGLAIACSTLNSNGTLGTRSSYILTSDLTSNSRYPSNLVQPSCLSSNAVVSVYYNDLATAGRTDVLDGTGIGCNTISSQGISSTESERRTPTDITNHGTPLQSIRCPAGSVAVGVTYDSFGSTYSTESDATDSVVRLICAPIEVTCGSSAQCSDGVDNDGDGRIDYPQDPGCTSSSDTSELNTITQCNDTSDNDSDGLVDYPEDPGCTSLSDTSEFNTTPQCGDGFDNDDDGLVDYPEDPGCTSTSDTTEFHTITQCNDGFDNDGDGLTDYPQDPGCASTSDTSEFNASAQCSDGVDNDGDGRIDYPQDPGCTSSSDTSELNSITQCNDSSDNDNDGLVDYPEDPGCTSLSDTSEFNASAQCSDGVDNDGDGLVDFGEDPGCVSSTDTSEFNASAQCSDGVDNDGDGRIDYPQDPGCTSSSDTSELNTITQCNDTSDNDNDGLVDYPEDPGCTSLSDTSEFNASAQCSDGVDNDGDGLVDFGEDPGCVSSTDTSEVNTSTSGADLSITKSAPNSVNRGDTVSYFLTLHNAGPGSASNVTVQDPIPAGLTYNAGASSAGCVQNGSTILCSNTSLSSGQSRSYVLSFNVTTALACGSIIRNRATVASSTTDPFSSNNASQTTSTTVSCPATFQCSDGVDNDNDGIIDFPQDPGCSSESDNSEFNSTPIFRCNDGLDNDGDGLVDYPQDPGCVSDTDDSEFDTPPPAFRCGDGLDNDGDGLVDYPQDPGCVDSGDDSEGDTFQCNDNFDNDGDGLIDYPADPGCFGHGDNDEANLQQANLSILKSGPSTTQRGSTVSYTLTASNAGPNTASNVRIQDAIPAGLTFSAAGSSSICTQSSSSISCGTFSLLSGQSRSVIISFTVPSTYTCNGVIQNRGTVSSSTADPTPSNNTSQTINTTVTCPVVTQCSDDADNDGDGLIDYPQDSGCADANDNDETNVVQANLSIVKSGPSNVEPGNTVTYTVTTNNSGPSTASNVTIQDQIPAGLTFNAGGSSSSCVQNGNTISCNNFSMSVGQSRSVLISFMVPFNYACGGTIQNRATVTSPTPDPTPSNNTSATITTNVNCASVPQCSDGDDNDTDGLVDYPEDPGCSSTTDNDETNVSGADLSVSKSGIGSVERGSNVSYTIRATNAGPNTASNVTIQDAIPSGLIFNPSGSSSTCFQNGSSITCNIFSLSSGQSRSVLLSFTVPSSFTCGGTIRNSATVSSSTMDPVPSNNSSQTVSTTVTCPEVFLCSDGDDNDGDGLVDYPQDPGCSSTTDDDESNVAGANLSVTKSGPTSVQRGNTVTYIITTNNAGPNTASSVRIEDPIPSGLTFNPSGSSTTCSQNGSSITCNNFNMRSGQSRSVVISFIVPSSHTCNSVIQNTATVSSLTTDPVPSNNTSQTVQTSVACPVTFQCSDGDDNDGDGSVDYPADPGCSETTDDDESNVVSANIGITKSGPSSVQRGNNVTYSLTATNTGPSTATSVVIQDPIPPGLTFNSAGSSTSCTQNGANVVCNNFNLVSGQSKTILISFTVPSTFTCNGSIQNTATISSPTPDPSSANNTSQTVSTTVTCATVFQCSDGDDNDGDGFIDFPADPGCESSTDTDETDPSSANLAIQKGGPNGVSPGESILYSINVYNSGPGTAENITIQDPIPPGLIFNPSGSTSNCVQNGNNILCNNFSLTSGQPRNFFLLFDVPEDAFCGDVIQNQATVSSSTTDPVSSNNTSQTVETDVTCSTAFQCNDGVDNDGDTFIDFPTEPNCSSATDDSEAS